ncbi:MAG: hypothetical protein GWN47_00100 [Woeseiaceae bacterium]|nr:hypothetical protein [Woeseiaceae bacterium]
MRIRTIARGRFDVLKVQQAIKWTVYTLLIINFGYYIVEDWTRAIHTLRDGASFLDWAREFATSIDELGWFILLAMFELETYVLEDKEWKSWVRRTVRGLRVACYAMILHTVYAYFVSVTSLYPTAVVEGVSDLCDMRDADVSYVYNLEYTKVDENSCGVLSSASQFYWVGEDTIVSDRAGLDLERDLAWVDLAEASIWLVIVLAIELVVRLQDRGVTGGPLLRTGNGVQVGLYAVLIGIGIYWATLSHWLYFWDELVWIGGFAIIDMNISEWRDELIQEKETP